MSGAALSRLAAFLVLPFAASAFLTAQARFEAGVDLVALDVCATDRLGRATTLAPGDLMVFDNGVRQQVALFSAGDRIPLAVTVLVDSSWSMRRGLLDRATAAAGALIRQLPEDSLVEAISFNDRATVKYAMGSDHRKAELSLAELSPAGETALYEAVLVAIRNQQRAARGRSGDYRQVIVLLTDGANTAGRVEFDEVVDEARRSGMLMYPVALLPQDSPSSAPSWELTQLAVDSGGESIAARHPEDLTGIYERIAREVRNLYRVGYVPSPLIRDGSWHRIQVRAVPADVTVRVRSGYYAPYH